MFRSPLLVCSALALLGAAAALAGDRTWHPDLESGVTAARKSGKPILVVTAWKSGI